MSMMGSTGVDPMSVLAAMRGQQQGPIGPNQGLGAPQLGAPPANNPSSGAPAPQANGPMQNAMDGLAQAASGGGDVQKLAQHIRELQKMYPKLLVAAHNNGHAELTGPAQEQFLAAAYGRMKGAKVATVRNDGKGQRLHLEWA